MSSVFSYVKTGAVMALVALASLYANDLFSFFQSTHDVETITIFFEISLLGLLSFFVFYLAQKTIIPSFVLALVFGMAARSLLLPIIDSDVVLSTIVTLGATLILFGGGLEITFESFRRLFYKITSISFIGFLATSILFSQGLLLASSYFHIPLPLPLALLLGVILASTDPAAVIPALSKLRFHNRDVKDIIISESAITDAVGAVLTLLVLSRITHGNAKLPENLFGAYQYLFSQGETWMLLSKEVGLGILLGFGGYGLLEALKHLKIRTNQEAGVDANYFIGVPIVIFALALLVGGNGFVAAFISGLLILVTEHLHETEHYFNHTIDGFLKPTIFLLLGALVDMGTLLQFAPIGIAMAFLFMLVIRPIAVWLSLSPFLLTKHKLPPKELWFISFIRETGAIPAVLLVTVNGMNIPHSDALVAIGMWVILITLIIQPPLIPLVAKILGVAEPIQDDQELAICSHGESLVVLCTRGNSFPKRLPVVAKWASDHGVRHVALLSCLEGRYSTESAMALEKTAQDVFKGVNEDLHKHHKKGLKFSVITRQGFLQENLDKLIAEQGNVSVIFVGRKMLDYKISDIKKAQVPFFFID